MRSYCITQGAQPGALQQSEGWNRVGGGREVQEGEDICILMADSRCVAETNTLSSHYPSN